MEIVGVHLAAKHDPHDVKPLFGLKFRQQKQAAQDRQIGHANLQKPAIFEHAAAFAERLRQFVEIAEMFK